MSSTLFSHQTTETTTPPAGPRRTRRAARPGTANSRSGGLPSAAGTDLDEASAVIEAEAAAAGDPDVTTDLPVDDGGLEDAGPGEEYPAERPATGYAAAFDAAVELATCTWWAAATRSASPCTASRSRSAA